MYIIIYIYGHINSAINSPKDSVSGLTRASELVGDTYYEIYSKDWLM